jgi:hypothetical protein
MHIWLAAKERKMPHLAQRKVEGMFAVLRIREKELLQIKGPCPHDNCRLHDKHVGPCDIRKKKQD